ncbi:MAG TPA: hypothetical protein DHW22_08185, partial [Planctomycetaceae bacterium]|nr:hypothetical protein [Planctomycetaceae bacterium]
AIDRAGALDCFVILPGALFLRHSYVLQSMKSPLPARQRSNDRGYCFMATIQYGVGQGPFSLSGCFG